jgi:hypothetical protein
MTKIPIATLAALAMAASFANADVVVNDSTNVLNYTAYRNLFDAQGNFKPVTAAVAAGDHIVGIVKVKRTTVGGSTIWSSGTDGELTGILALRVVSLASPPDPNDPRQTAAAHAVFGPPTLTHFCRGSDCFDTGLSGNDMLALYRDASSTFSDLWGLQGNVTRATDGTLWLTAGYSAGADGAFGSADDAGYSYMHTQGTFPIGSNNDFHGLSVHTNNTGYGFAGANDPNETELGGFAVLTDLAGGGTIWINPNGTYVGGTSWWEIEGDGSFTVALGTTSGLACGLSLSSSASPASFSCKCRGSSCSCSGGVQSCAGGGYVTYSHTVSNNGAALSNVTVSDDRLGLIGTVATLNSGDTQTLTNKVCVTSSVTDNITAHGELADGESCSANAAVTVTVRKRN